MKIGIDANTAWDVDTAVRRITALDRWSLEYVEQPCATVEELAALRRRVDVPIELAMGLSGLEKSDRLLLESHGWKLVNAHPFTTDPWPFRDYVKASRAEFTVAKDQNVRLRSGWFGERDACYLASGKPVVAQDTGFSNILPTGEGLFAFTTADQAIAAIDEINSDYARHCAAARAIAEEFFEAGGVAARLLEAAGL